jgi:deazaflavin-dependent oxidoreductase (nitroreductase family)
MDTTERKIPFDDHPDLRFVYDSILLTTTGRRSKHHSSKPVLFVEQGDLIYVLPIAGTSTGWFKNILKDDKVTVTTSTGTVFHAKARPITDNAEVARIVQLFHEKYGRDRIISHHVNLNAAVEIKRMS